MKKYLLLLLLTQCHLTGSSRNMFTTAHRAKHFPGEITASEIIAKQKQNSSARKTTTLPVRLLGWGYSEFGVLTDSTRNYYSNGRGSTHPNTYSYTDQYYVGNPQYIQCDSSMFWMQTNAQMQRTAFRAYTYDNSNNVIGLVVAEFGYNKYDVSYTNNLVSSMIISDTNGSGNGTFIPISSGVKTYNAQGKLATDSFYSLQSAMPYYKTHYTYDANNNLVLQESYNYQGGIWTINNRVTSTYNNNLLQISVSEYDLGSGLQNVNKDSFAYTGSNVTYNSSYNWDATNTAWVPEARNDNYYNAQNYEDSFYIQTWNGTKWDTTEKDVFVYNADNLITNSMSYKFQNGSFNSTPYDHTNYYYESYFPASVSTVQQSANEIILYPNPATGMLHINTGITGKGSLSIVDMKGQLIYVREHVPLNDQSLDVSRYPAGNYIIRIADEKDQFIAQKQFEKI